MIKTRKKFIQGKLNKKIGELLLKMISHLTI